MVVVIDLMVCINMYEYIYSVAIEKDTIRKMSKERNKEFFKKWTPLEDIPPVIRYEDISLDRRGLRLQFIPDDDRQSLLLIRFVDVLMFRSIEEARFQKTIPLIKKAGHASLYIVKKSNLIYWFQEESYPLHHGQKLYHYFIDSLDVTFDIITNESMPDVKWLTRS